MGMNLLKGQEGIENKYIFSGYVPAKTFFVFYGYHYFYPYTGMGANIQPVNAEKGTI
jgi:hypothetical protein